MAPYAFLVEYAVTTFHRCGVRGESIWPARADIQQPIDKRDLHSVDRSPLVPPKSRFLGGLPDRRTQQPNMDQTLEVPLQSLRFRSCVGLYIDTCGGAYLKLLPTL